MAYIEKSCIFEVMHHILYQYIFGGEIAMTMPICCTATEKMFGEVCLQGNSCYRQTHCLVSQGLPYWLELEIIIKPSPIYSSKR